MDLQKKTTFRCQHITQLGSYWVVRQTSRKMVASIALGEIVNFVTLLLNNRPLQVALAFRRKMAGSMKRSRWD